MVQELRQGEEILLPENPNPNLKDYEEARRTFTWEDVEKEFTWYHTGKVNMAYEAIARHAESWRKNKLALIYVDREHEAKYTFAEMKEQTARVAAGLTSLGLEKGDRVFVFLPRSPELYIGILGIIKAGLVAGPLFEAFMEAAVKDRLMDSGARALITNAELLPRIPYRELPHLKHVIVVGAKDLPPSDDKTEFHRYEELVSKAPRDFEPVWLTREDGMIIHYSSGTTGKPKGIYHVHNAMIQQYITGKWVLDLKEEDIYWTTADPGWVTGTSYGIFAPWLNGVTNLVRGGRFNPDDWYGTIERYRITVWYSAPTALRMLMGAGEEVVKKYDLSSLRHVLSVGEPLNPEVIRWGYRVYKQRIHDTWWMTETGAHICVNFACLPIKPGSMGKPIPGVEIGILDDEGNEVSPNTPGNLCIKTPWPSMFRKVWNNEAKYQEYFRFPGWYISGDVAMKDEDGYFWFLGRADDVILTSGYRVGPFEIESKLVEHPAVVEAGVIGKPDPERGEIIKAFVVLREGYQPSEELEKELRDFVKKGLSAHSVPREIEFRDKLPKTRSGKIVRRVLKAWELGLPAGDLSTLED